MAKNINNITRDALYQKTIARIKRSNELYKVLYGKEVEFMEKKTFKKFYEQFEEYTKFSKEEKERINWLIFVFFNRQKRLGNKVITSSFTSIFTRGSLKYLRNLNEDEIKKLVDVLLKYNVKLSSISGMFNGRGLPDLKKLEEFLKVIKEEKVKLSSVSGMFNGRGLPDLKKLKEFLKVIKEEEVELSSITGMLCGKGLPDLRRLKEFLKVIKEEEVELSSITGMLARKGLPDMKELKKFLEFIKKEKVELSSITGMLHGKGLPDLEKLREFLEFIKEEGVELSSITGMLARKGLPDMKELKKFLEFIKKEKVELSSITGMLAGKGLPDMEKLKEFLEFIKREGIELSSITGMLNGKGLPDMKKLKEFLEVIKKEEVELLSVTWILNGKGLPDIKKLKEFISYVKRKSIELKFISGVMHGKGLPDKKVLNKLENIDKIVNNFVRDLDTNLPRRNIVSMKVYAYKYMEENNITEVDIEKELKALGGFIREKGLQYLVYDEREITGLDKYYEHVKKNGLTELQGYILLKINQKNILGVLKLVRGKESIPKIVYVEDLKEREEIGGVVIGKKDDGYEKMEIESVWKEIFKRIKGNSRLSEPEKEKIISMLGKIKKGENISNEDILHLRKVFMEDNELIRLVREFFV